MVRKVTIFATLPPDLTDSLKRKINSRTMEQGV